MTKEQFTALVKSLPKKWYIDGNRVAICYIAKLEGRAEPIPVCARYYRMHPVAVKTFDTKEEALAELEVRKAKKARELDNALTLVATYVESKRWKLSKIAGKDNRVKRILDACGDAKQTRDRENYADQIEELRFFIRTGMLNIGGTTFPKEEVAAIHYGQPADDWRASTTPIEVVLRNGDKLTTKRKEESVLLQAIFGQNTSGWRWDNIKWPRTISIDD